LPLDSPPHRGSGGAWTIPLLCAGLALIACCLLIPAADENRRLAHEKLQLERDLQQLELQLSVNEEFLDRLADDPTLLERLAQRQMKLVREGISVLDVPGTEGDEEMSPYMLVTIPPPKPLPPYAPVGGKLAELCRHPKSQLYLTGLGLILVAAGLVLGEGRSRPI
jgi:hypothetical protein